MEKEKCSSISEVNMKGPKVGGFMIRKLHWSLHARVSEKPANRPEEGRSTCPLTQGAVTLCRRKQLSGQQELCAFLKLAQRSVRKALFQIFIKKTTFFPFGCCVACWFTSETSNVLCNTVVRRFPETKCSARCTQNKLLQPGEQHLEDNQI